tara:strand:+ start:900 stop:1154 length:255 start_codon:yes stop_codon:yes gene_type:complete
MSVKIIHENCDPEKANDKSLPYTAYLVTYLQEGKKTYDVTICNKKVDLFDHYYDKYKKNFIGFEQGEGRMNPKMYNFNDGSKKK